MNITRKITYSAVFSAISCLFMVLSHATPATVTLLVVPAVCFYLCLKKCGFGYGLITIGLSLFISLLIDGFVPCASFLFAALYFAPYAVIAFFLQKLTYAVPWQAVLRVVLFGVFFAGMTVLIIFLFDQIFDTSIGDLVLKMGKGIAIAVIAVIFLPFDFFFNYMTQRLLKLLK